MLEVPKNGMWRLEHWGIKKGEGELGNSWINIGLYLSLVFSWYFLLFRDQAILLHIYVPFQKLGRVGEALPQGHIIAFISLCFCYYIILVYNIYKVEHFEYSTF